MEPMGSNNDADGPILRIGPKPDRSRFSVAALMLVVALCGIFLAITRAFPLAGLMLGSSALPALEFTRRRSVARRRDHRPYTAVGWVAAWAGMTVVVLLAILGSIVAIGVAVLLIFTLYDALTRG